MEKIKTFCQWFSPGDPWWVGAILIALAILAIGWLLARGAGQMILAALTGGLP